MKITTLRCKNCGGDLPVSSDADLVQCAYCKTAHKVERSNDGAPNVTMLEAAVRAVHEDVQVIDQKIDQSFLYQRSLAEKENARLDLKRLETQYAERMDDWNETRYRTDQTFERWMTDLREEQKEPIGMAQAMVLAGLFFVAVAVLILIAASEQLRKGPEMFPFILKLSLWIGGIMFSLGVIWLKMLFAKPGRVRAEYKERVARLEKSKRDMEIAMNEKAAVLQEIVERRIETV